jgi:hypothetical protein
MVAPHIKQFVLEVGMFVWEGLVVSDGGGWHTFVNAMLCLSV